MKSALSLSDRDMTKVINIFDEERPEMNYENLPRDGKNLSKVLRKYMKSKPHIRKVQDGLSCIDQPRLNGSLPRGGPSKNPRKEGDVADFSIQESLYNYGPGMVHATKHRQLLRRLNAAYPLLLSPDLLRAADEVQFNKEKTNGSLGNRPSMNYFSLKFHLDGVQVAKNGRKPQAIPVLAAIEAIAPYDPVSKTVDVSSSVRIPYGHIRPFLVSFYHGSKKPNQHEFLREFFDELVLLDPNADVPNGKSRLCTVQIFCVICDSPMKSWVTGKYAFCLCHYFI